MTVLNTRGRIASLRPATSGEAELYAVPAATEIDGVLRICNQDGTARSFRVAHCHALHGDTAAEAADWLFYDKAIPSNDTIEISIHAKATETIRVKSSNADLISFHLSGNVKVVSQ